MRHFYHLSLSLGALLLLCQCQGSGDNLFEESSLLSLDTVYDGWPNDSTTDTDSSQIVSKVLVTDLNNDENLENIFISVLPQSSNKKNSVLRITSGDEFIEVKNYKANRIFLFHDSTPFSFDINSDGPKELFFVSFDRQKIYSFGFKNGELKEIFLRWRLKLPKELPEDFDRQMEFVKGETQNYIRVGKYGFYEKSNRKPKFIKLDPE